MGGRDRRICEGELRAAIAPARLLVAAGIAFAGVAMAGGDSARAQSPITAEVDRTALAMDEALTLTITVRAESQNAPGPEIPDFDGFEVVGNSSARQITIVNGAISTESTLTFRLRPIREGDLAIPPVQVTLNGQTYRTDPIAITVGPGAAPPSGVPAPGLPAPGPPAPGAGPTPPAEEGESEVSPGSSSEPLFVTAEVDNPRPFVGQVLVYTFRFYRDQSARVSVQPRYDGPDFTGFWNKYQPEQTRQVRRIGGRVFQVSVLRTVLFPTAAGPATISPASLVLRGGFFNSDSVLRTDAVTLDVQPLPPGAPDGFDGAVGQYSLRAEADGHQGRVDEPLALRVTLSGAGNIDALPEPRWPSPPAGWREFEGRSTTQARAENGRVTGEKQYERLLVPGRAGEAEIAPIRYIYFDPAAKAYRTLESAPIAVSIAGGDPAASGSGAPPAEPGDAARGAAASAADGAGDDAGGEDTRLTAGLRPLKLGAVGTDGDQWGLDGRAAGASLPTGRLLGARPMTWLLWLLPLVVVVAGTVRRPRGDVAVGTRPTDDLSPSRALLEQARQPGADAYGLAHLALAGYLERRLGESVGGMTRERVADQMREAGIEPALVARVSDCLRDCEAGRYAPNGAGDSMSGMAVPAASLESESARLVGEVGGVLNALDEAWPRSMPPGDRS